MQRTVDFSDTAISGVMATLAHDGFMTPFDMLKQRMQIGSHSSTWQCFRHVASTEGYRAFYISFPTTVSMSIPFQAVQFTTYEKVRKMLNPSEGYNPMVHVISGGVAGGVASVLTNPLGSII